MHKRRRVCCLLLAAAVLCGLAAGCSRGKTSGESREKADMSSLLASVNDEEDTGFSQLTEGFQNPVLAGGRVYALGWGWQQEDAAAEPRQVTLLLSADTDGSHAESTVLQLSVQEDGKETQTAMRACALLPDAGDRIFLLADAVPAAADAPQKTDRYMLFRLENDGTAVQPQALSGLDGLGTVLDARTAQNTAWLLMTDALVRLNLTDNSLQKIPLGNGNVNPEILLSPDGEAVLTDLNGGWYKTDAGVLSERRSLPAALGAGHMLCPVNLRTGETTDAVMLWDGYGIFKWNPEDNTAEKVFDWLNSGLNADELLDVLSLGDGRYLAVRQKQEQDAELHFVILTPATPEMLARRTVLTLGLAEEMSPALGEAILSFNGASTDVFIQTVDYTADGADAGLDRQETDLLTGHAPDILLLPNSLSNNSLIRQGLFVDLAPMLAADPEVSRGELQENILSACEFNGQLPTVTAAYDILTAVGAAGTVGPDPGWSWEEFQKVCEAHPQADTPFQWFNRSSVLLYQVQAGGDAYVDYAAGQAHFDTPQFARLLESCSPYSEQMNTVYGNTKRAFSEGHSLLMIQWLTGFDCIRDLYHILDGEIAYKGFPGENSTGGVLVPRIRVGITRGCADPGSAWQFVRTLLLPEFQNRLAQLPASEQHFPLRKDSLQLAMEAAAQPPDPKNLVLPDGIDAGVLEDENSYWLQGIPTERSQRLMDMLGRVNTVYQYDPTVGDLLQQESAAYFSGSISAGAAAQNLQRRVQLYLDEQA